MSSTAYLRGVLLALTTAFLWSLLPILTKLAVKEFSGGTIVWFRFTFSFIILFGLLYFRNKNPLSILFKPPLLAVMGGIFLGINYFLFLKGVETSSPTNAGVLVQLAPLIVVIIGVKIFGERFNAKQWMGLGLAMIGFVIFFRDQINHSSNVQIYTTASLYILGAALTWATYITLQKILSPDYEAQQLNLLVYGTASLLLVYFVKWGEFLNQSSGNWVLMIVLGINTLLAYGCLAEAVKYIPLSIISVIITLHPFITMMLMYFIPKVYPGLLPEKISAFGYVGASIAILGVIFVIRKN